MERILLPKRNGWEQEAENYGFAFHTINGEPYWMDDVAYKFSLSQIETDIEDVTQEIHNMAMELVDDVVHSEEKLTKLRIPKKAWDAISASWRRRDPAVYGRIDLAYNGKGPAKLYEFNYDTPTSIYEAAFFQWMWLEDRIKRGHISKNADQFNSIQEKLIEAWGSVGIRLKRRLVLSSTEGHIEDRGTIEYLADCAKQAGLDVHTVDLEKIGLGTFNGESRFIDDEDRIVDLWFKLYPIENAFYDEYGDELLAQIKDTRLVTVEPIWKAILSNKGILPLLWEKFKGHPNLLPAKFVSNDESLEKGWVHKRFFSREGANVDMAPNEYSETLHSDGDYSEDAKIAQACHLLPNFNGNHPVIGSWVVNGQACGMGIREDDSLITKDTSRFVPHIIVD